MKKATLAIVLAAISIVLVAYRFQPQLNVTSANNVNRGGPALPLLGTAQDASTDGDTQGSTATASLTCAHTGAVVTSGFNQFTVQIEYVNSAATALKMECDTYLSTSAVWSPITVVQSDGTSTERTWSHAVSADANIVWNFDINAEQVRCRFWTTSGDSSDTVSVEVRLASEVEG